MTTIISGSNGLTFPDNSTQAVGFYGFKNRIINGAMVIDQRNAGASVTPTNGQYTLDRWVAFQSTAGKFSVQQTPSATETGYATRVNAGFTNYLAVTSLSAYSVGSSDYYMIGTKIENLNIADLAWGTSNAKTVTLSFWVYSSLTGTFGGALLTSSSNYAYPFSYSIPVANTWTQITVTVTGPTSGTWTVSNSASLNVYFGLGVGSTYSNTAGAWSSTNAFSATGATSVVGTNGATFYVTGVQLEKGSTATSFDYRPYGTELMLCQRYFVRMIDPPLRGVVGSTTDASRVACSLPVQMRSAPTMTFSQVGPTGNARFFDGTTSTGVISTLNNQYSTNQRIELDFTTTASTYVVGRASCLYLDTGGNYSSAFNITAEL
jgi:hypothetical protein